MTNAPDASREGDLAYQATILQRVSRTFAFTIPQLPDGLRDVVANVYLLCRIADTIEDEPALTLEQKRAFSEHFVDVVAGRGDAAAFARDLGALLSPETTEAEHDLIANAPRVIRVTLGCRDPQRRAMERCIRIMSNGMVEFQEYGTATGLKDVPHLERYCYYVAGVVGETVTALFCDYSVEMDNRREKLLALAVSFGQGLQITNILKDVWDDRRRGACWLPRDLFGPPGRESSGVSIDPAGPYFSDGFLKLLTIARRRLADGLQFILVIPARETGIRRHLLWTLGLSVLTWRRLCTTPSFRNGENIRLSRMGVRAAVLLMNVFARSDSVLKLLFAAATRSFPPAER